MTFTRRDGVVVTVSLYEWRHPDDGSPAFSAWTCGYPDNQHTPPQVVTVGNSAVLDGVRVTVVANWTGSKYGSDAVDLRLADAGS